MNLTKLQKELLYKAGKNFRMHVPLDAKITAKSLTKRGLIVYHHDSIGAGMVLTPTGKAEFQRLFV